MADFRTSIANDYLYWEGREPLSWYRSTLSGPDLVRQLTDCKRRRLTYRELATAGGGYVSQDIRWCVPVAVLPDGVDPDSAPRIRDYFVDGAGRQWIVMSTELNTLRTWWAFNARCVQLVYGLTQTVDVYVPVNAGDSAGNRVPVYGETPTYAALPCRLQERGAQRQEGLGKLAFVRNYNLYTQSIVATAESRFVVDGVNYQAVSHAEPDNVGNLMEFTLEKMP